MRVAAGKFKGRVLEKNVFEHIRPTADIVKQAIFNKLTNLIDDGAKVLDLFCGTGALGIEAISRGASECVFVDKDTRSVGLVKRNLSKLGIVAKVYRCSFKDAIRLLSGQQFDVIILDPPYKAGLYDNALKAIFENRILSEKGVIVCEHAREEKIDFSLFLVESTKDYGSKSVTYLVNK